MEEEHNRNILYGKKNLLPLKIKIGNKRNSE